MIQSSGCLAAEHQQQLGEFWYNRGILHSAGTSQSELAREAGRPLHAFRLLTQREHQGHFD